MSQVFLTASFDITDDFHILHSAYKVTYTFVIPSLKQKFTTGSLTHTHTTINNYKQKATGHVTSLANGHFTGSEAPFVCEIPTALSKKNWTGCGEACRLCSNEGMFQAFTLVWQTAQNRRLYKKWGNLLSELHVSHRQCLAGISNAFSASFTSIWLSFPRFYCTPNKACLFCTTPAGTY